MSVLSYSSLYDWLFIFQTFGIIFTLGMGAIMDRFGILAANLSVAGMLLVGTIGTAIIKSDLRRQAAGKQVSHYISFKECLNSHIHYIPHSSAYF